MYLSNQNDRDGEPSDSRPPLAYTLSPEALAVRAQVAGGPKMAHINLKQRADKDVCTQYFCHQTVQFKTKHRMTVLPAGAWGQSTASVRSCRTSPGAKTALQILGRQSLQITVIP